MPRPSARGKIVDAALDTFHACGFNGCSIQDIVDAAGVPKGSFFNHFKGKDLLALEVLQRYGEGNRMDLLFDQAKPPLERLRDHFEFLAQSYEQWGYERGCLLGNFATEMSAAHPDMRAALKGMFEAWCGAVASIIREAQLRREVDPARDADVLAHFIVNAWEGVAMRLKVVRQRHPVDEFFEVCFRLILAPAPAA